MITDCQIADLFQHPDHIPLVAQWIYDEFWADKEAFTPEALAGLLRTATDPREVPLSLLAFDGDQPVGTVNLIENDDENRPHLRPWLAALYVLPECRNRGVGSQLVRALKGRADAMGIDNLYLGTDNPGFYERLGAQAHEQLAEDFCIMRLSTG